MLDVVKIRVEMPRSSGSPPRHPCAGDDCGFVLCDSRKAHVEKQCPKVWGEY